MLKYDINQSMIKMWYKSKYFKNQNMAKYDIIRCKSKYDTYRNMIQVQVWYKPKYDINQNIIQMKYVKVWYNMK